MISKKTKIIIFFLCVFVLFGIGFFTFAKDLEVEYPSFPETPTLTEKSAITDYIIYIFNFVIYASGFVALGVLIYSGIIYLLSAGNPEKQRDARGRIFAGFIGIIIILSSYFILTTINPNLVIVHISKEGVNITPPEKPPEPPKEEKKTITYFQTPAGKIIEIILLDDEAKKILGTKNDGDDDARVREEGEEYPDTVIGQASKARDLSKQLLELSLQLKELADRCKCGPSNCAPAPACNGINCPNINCKELFDKSEELKRKINEKRDDLLEQQKEIRKKQLALIKKILELKKPSFLMSVLAEETDDYKTMLTNRHFLEEQNIEAIIETFEEWKAPDNSLVMDIRTGFEDRKELPPTFDPATFYFEGKGNKKNEVFMKKAKIIDDKNLRGEIINALGTEPDSKVSKSVEELLTDIINKALIK